MPSGNVFARQPPGWQPIADLLASDGSGATVTLVRLVAPRTPLRDLADALHCLCLLHGHRPGLIDIARDRDGSPENGERLAEAAAGFSGERDWLTRLIAALGPTPATVNQTAAENAIATQRHALEMLAASDRRGVALGAASALVADWHAVRVALDRIGDRLGLSPPPSALPPATDFAALFPAAPAQARAFHFGAQQVLAQQRGLWALVDARAEARGAD